MQTDTKNVFLNQVFKEIQDNQQFIRRSEEQFKEYAKNKSTYKQDQIKFIIQRHNQDYIQKLLFINRAILQKIQTLDQEYFTNQLLLHKRSILRNTLKDSQTQLTKLIKNWQSKELQIRKVLRFTDFVRHFN